MISDIHTSLPESATLLQSDYEKLDYNITEKFSQFRDDETVICMKKEF